MGEHRSEDLKGRAKEAAGSVTDDEDLEREGQADQAAASAKKKFGKATDKVKDAFTKDSDADSRG